MIPMRKIGGRRRHWVLLVVMLVALETGAQADVVIFDQIAVPHEAVYLKVRTRGRFLADGGRRVRLRIGHKDNLHLLTGADGFGYGQYTPAAPGLFDLQARSGHDQSEGRLLVVNPQTRVVFIEVESSLRPHPLQDRAREGAPAAVRTLSQRYTCAYLAAFNRLFPARPWLQKHGFPPSVILTERDSGLFKRLAERGITIYTVIASPPVLSAAAEQAVIRLSFDQTDEATVVKSWDEIAGMLP
jgi:hypothetical protein